MTSPWFDSTGTERPISCTRGPRFTSGDLATALSGMDSVIVSRSLGSVMVRMPEWQAEYNKTSQNQPTTYPILIGPFKEVVGLGSWEIGTMDNHFGPK